MSLDYLSKIIDFEFDHVGIAVHSIDNQSIYDSLGIAVGSTEEVATEKVRVKMYELSNSCRVELLEPLSSDSVIARFLEKKGPGIHHICLRVKNIVGVLEKLKRQNIRLVNDKPVQGAHHCLVAFIHPSSAGGVLIELSEPQRVVNHA